jgi:hypothetical protein
MGKSINLMGKTLPVGTWKALAKERNIAQGFMLTLTVAFIEVGTFPMIILTKQPIPLKVFIIYYSMTSWLERPSLF